MGQVTGRVSSTRHRLAGTDIRPMWSRIAEGVSTGGTHFTGVYPRANPGPWELLPRRGRGQSERSAGLRQAGRLQVSGQARPLAACGGGRYPAAAVGVPAPVRPPGLPALSTAVIHREPATLARCRQHTLSTT